jgi:hypothetical protein
MKPATPVVEATADDETQKAPRRWPFAFRLP